MPPGRIIVQHSRVLSLVYAVRKDRPRRAAGRRPFAVEQRQRKDGRRALRKIDRATPLGAHAVFRVALE